MSLSLFGPSNSSEIKYFDTYSIKYAAGPVYPGLKFTSTGTIFLLFSPILGTTSKTRLGRKCSLKSVEIRGICYSTFLTNYIYTTPTNAVMTLTTPAGNLNTGLVRLQLIYDKQPNGAAPTLSDILSTTSGGASRNHIKIDQRDRLSILKDKVFILGGGNGSTAQKWFLMNDQHSYAIKIFKKLNNIETTFNSGTAGTIADINTGALFLVSSGTQGTLNPDPYMDSMHRVAFTDIKTC